MFLAQMDGLRHDRSSVKEALHADVSPEDSAPAGPGPGLALAASGRYEPVRVELGTRSMEPAISCCDSVITVNVLAQPGIIGGLSSVLGENPRAGFGVRTHNPREVLGISYQADDLLIIDDDTLGDVPGLVAAIGELPCRKVLVGAVADAAAARRALLLKALYMVDRQRALEELGELLKGLIPIPTPMKSWLGAIYSAKGGVGKSTIALNLAWALALRSERNVALVDVDPLGDIGAMIQEKPGATLVDLVEGLRSGLAEDKALLSLYRVKALGLTVVPASLEARPDTGIAPEDLERVLTILKENYDYIILDLATGLTDLNLAALDAVEKILVVAAPERVALLAVRRSLDIFRRLYPAKLELVLNRADSDTGLGDEEVEDALSSPIRYRFPSGGSSPARAANRGRPLILADARNPLSRAFVEMAQDITGEREGVHRRLRHWFGREG